MLRWTCMWVSLVVACGGGDDRRRGMVDGGGRADAAGAEDAGGGRTDGGGDAGGSSDASVPAANPVQLYRGSGMGGVVPDWDPDAPRPLVIFNKGGIDDAWRPTNALVDASGTLSSFADTIVVWGFTHPLDVIYDGPFRGGVIPGWSMDDPPPLIAMGTGGPYGDAWGPLDTGEAVGDAGGLAGSSVTRVVVFGWSGAADEPASLYFGPNDGSFVVAGWTPTEPLPLLFWGRTDTESLWHLHSIAVLTDATLDPSVPGRVRVYGW